MEAKDIIQDNNGEIRFKVGTQVCGICKTKDNIIQLYKFSHIVNRCMDWTEHHNKIEIKPYEVSGNSSQS